MRNTVVAEYEMLDDAFVFDRFYLEGKVQQRKTVAKLISALQQQLGTEIAVQLLRDELDRIEKGSR